MRVFVVGTGRCGTSTFFQACRHITNFTAGHESKAGLLVPECADYADGHIEIAGHLAIKMGLLREKYPDARWVHLVRDRAACIQSQAGQSQVQLDAFVRHWMQKFQPIWTEAAATFVDCMNANIRMMLPREPGQFMTIRTETAGEQWADFWQWIGASGDFTASRGEWQRKYNPGVKRGRDNFV